MNKISRTGGKMGLVGLLILGFFIFPFAINAQFVGGTIGSNQCINSNTAPAGFTSVSPATGWAIPPTYTWEKSTDLTFASFSNIGSGLTYNELSNLTVVTYYRRRATDLINADVFSNTITVGIKPVFNPGLPLPIICQGVTAFSVNYTTNNFPNQYNIIWDATASAAGFVNVNQSLSSNNLPALSGSLPVTAPGNAPAGTYNGSLSVRVSSTGCSSTPQSAFVVVNPLPIATISGTTEVCQNGSVPLITLASSVATAPFTFTYKINNGASQTVSTSSGNNSVTVSVPTGTVGALAYSLVSAQESSITTCSVTATGTATVTVNPLPTASISGTNTVCQNASSPITFTGANGTAPYTFTYNINGGSSQTVTTTSGNSVIVLAQTGTVGTVIYTLVSVQDGSVSTCSNTASGTATVTIKQLPTATIGGTTTVCQNGTSPLVTFTGSNGNAPYTFTYKINGGSDQIVTTISGNSVTVLVPTGTAGTFIYSLVSVLESSGTVCINSVTGIATVTVNPLPTVTVIPTSIAFTSGMTTTLTASGASTYTWAPPISLSATSGSSVIASPLTRTAYTGTGTDANGCTNTATSTITVNPIITAGTIGSNQTICSNTTPVSLTSITVASGGTGTINYQWQQSTDNVNFSNIAGAATIAYSPGTLTQTIYYRRGARTSVDAIVYTSSIAVTVNPLPTVTVNPTSIAFTSGMTNTLAASGGSTYTWAPSTSLSATNGSSVIASPASSIVYTVTGTDANSCTNTATSTITVNPIVTAGGIGSNQTICSYTTPASLTSATVASGGTGTINYQWQQSTDNIIFSNIVGATTATHSPGALTQTTYYRRGARTSVDVIVYTSSITVNVNPIPTVTIIPTSIAFTTGMTTTLTASGASTYMWTPPTSLSATNGSSVLASPTSSIVYTVAGTDVNGCTNTATSIITINPIVTTGAIGSNQTICSNTTPASLTSVTVASGGTGTINYQWQQSTDNIIFSNIVGATSATHSPGVLTQTTYYRRGARTAMDATVYTSPVTVTVILSVGGTALGAATVCANINNTTLSVNSTTGLIKKWQSSTVADFSSAVTDITVAAGNISVINLTATTYYRAVIQNSTCATANSSAVTVTVNPLPPVPTISGTTSFCSGSSTTLTASTASSYVWSTGATTQSINAIIGGNYSVTVFNASGCSSTNATTATAFALPVIFITNPVAVCSPVAIDLNSASITAGSTTGVSYTQWRNASATTALTNANAITLTGTYYIKATQTSTGCSVIKPVTVTVNSTPTVIITHPAAVCVPSLINLSSAVITAGSSSGLTYTYWTDAATTNPLQNAQAINAGGTYYIKGTTQENCFDTKPVTVIINPLPIGAIQTPVANYICEGIPRVLTASTADAWQWFLNQQPIAGATGSSYPATAAGNYTVQFTSREGCVNTAANSVQLDLFVKPVVDFIPDKRCLNSPVNFINRSSFANSGSIAWQWNFGDRNTSSVFSPSHVYAAEGMYTISLTADNLSCPSLTANFTNAYFIESPVTGIRYTPITAVVNEPVTLTARSFGAKYVWKPSVDLNSYTIPSPVATLRAEQLYTVDIISAEGCVTTDTVLVKVFPASEIFVPQGFTPNGDTQNDRLYPNLVQVSKLVYFKIFNRWGNMIFQTNSPMPENGWNGKYNGTDQPVGTYTWIAEVIDLNGKSIRRSGIVLLIK